MAVKVDYKLVNFISFDGLLTQDRAAIVEERMKQGKPISDVSYGEFIQLCTYIKGGEIHPSIEIYNQLCRGWNRIEQDHAWRKEKIYFEIFPADQSESLREDILNYISRWSAGEELNQYERAAMHAGSIIFDKKEELENAETKRKNNKM
ncbi:hypothetical protein [Anaeromicropila populeti]|uniref:Uncharacterized protein n=1 Tax=Anaeromicropila populeti TaxID=37658 RepID=A0A1I6HU21_9FIRM|nr:hypothetical protein [Anaeromicropila populeti]SFR57897.1 hypothetical protein SAMN05661086_00289 [Anaeromicropila populeti]